eukprot:TRINITY_DN106183_c0_g1_i1.p1 TRINITY_DN106183_c0_g1~~TRINITY_DN106183_c0_g1_i1.p1  ORF type:complete len:165 (+),score=5.75 TRINITY_DN106183_c0_g1_i1:385-879(+)
MTNMKYSWPETFPWTLRRYQRIGLYLSAISRTKNQNLESTYIPLKFLNRKCKPYESGYFDMHRGKSDIKINKKNVEDEMSRWLGHWAQMTHKRTKSCLLLVIYGKGEHSPDKIPVLKPLAKGFIEYLHRRNKISWYHLNEGSCLIVLKIKDDLHNTTGGLKKKR